MRKLTQVAIAILLLLSLFPAVVQAEEGWSVEQAGNITSISVAEDGSRIAVGGYGAKAFVFDSAGKQQFAVDAKNVVTGVNLLNNGNLIVSSDDRHLYAYDSAGKLLWDTNMKRQVKDVSSSPDGSIISVIIQNSTELQYIDGATGEVKGTADISIGMKSVSVSGNGQWVAVGATDQYIHLLDSEGKVVRKMGLDSAVESVAVSDEGEVAAGTTAYAVELFDKEGKRDAKLAAKDIVTDVAFTRDGQFIGVSDFSGNFYVFSRAGKKLWETKVSGAGREVEFDKEGKTLYGGTEQGQVHKYDVGTVVEGAKKQARNQALLLSAIGVAVVLLILFGLYVMKKRNRLGIFKTIWRSKLIYLGLAPSFLLLFVFLYYPAFSGLFHSLYDWNPGGRTTFVGLDNFKRMFEDPYVAKGMGNLGLLIVTGLFKTLIPPLIVAELIFFLRSKKMQYWFRTAFTASMIIPGVAMLLIWQNLYDPNIGLFNQLLSGLGLGTFAHAWLGDPNTALWAIIFIGFPFIGILQLLVFYAGLLGIPDELIESAKMDGATLPRIIRSIHLPLLAGQFKFLIILALIGIVQDFNGILIVTGGGPMDSTYVPALQMYYAATKFDDLGYASALGVAMFFVILIITVINLKFLKTQD
ncbi:ABC transporter permease subunit [Paenibacillus mendelii]|uniref:ABC transporter permease subunit n=1 Tax=Paenibacillus mendelii TaxID=206163 RepID=A0ABV6J6R1_9BACL|nr:ABC transporter permease subunit [Paenibacillus mendelii]MCQ6561069.1 ABC transporter permease subunit [Paenibacillus mendelii]